MIAALAQTGSPRFPSMEGASPGAMRVATAEGRAGAGPASAAAGRRSALKRSARHRQLTPTRIRAPFPRSGEVTCPHGTRAWLTNPLTDGKYVLRETSPATAAGQCGARYRDSLTERYEQLACSVNFQR